MCHISQGLKLETYLRSIGFTYPAEPSKVPPAERVDILNGRIAALQKEIDKNEAEIRTHKNRREDLLYTIDYFTMRTEKYDVLGRLWQSPHVFLITGYIPAENAEALKTELTTTQEAYVELCDPSDADDVPVKLKTTSSLPRSRACWKATACRASMKSTQAASWRSSITFYSA